MLKKNDFQLSITEILDAGLDLIVSYAEERELGTNPLAMKTINDIGGIGGAVQECKH